MIIGLIQPKRVNTLFDCCRSYYLNLNPTLDLWICGNTLDCFMKKCLPAIFIVFYTVFLFYNFSFHLDPLSLSCFTLFLSVIVLTSPLPRLFMYLSMVSLLCSFKEACESTKTQLIYLLYIVFIKILLNNIMFTNFKYAQHFLLAQRFDLIH